MIVSVEEEKAIYWVKQNFLIGGFFDIGMYEYDNNFIFIPWEKAENFLSTKEIAHGIEIFLNSQEFTSQVYDDIKLKLNDNFSIIFYAHSIASLCFCVLS